MAKALRALVSEYFRGDISARFLSQRSVLERVSRNNERPLLQTKDPRKTIVNLLSQRSDLYNQCCDERIPTDGLSVEEISFGIAESARLWFSKMS